MLNQIFAIAISAAMAAGAGYANPSRTTVKIPVTRTEPTSGKQMFTAYCAPCHGIDGKGTGPYASALKTRPTDLTQLTRHHNGRYPDTHVVATLQDGGRIGDPMPAWGPILGKMSQVNSQERLLRISNLSRFVETLQSK